MLKSFLLLLTAACLTSISLCSQAEALTWSGSVAIKNNYVFSTGTEIEENPVFQFWINAQFKNGLFVDLWTNMPLEPGNPNRSAELDWQAGYIQTIGDHKIKYAMAYYDIQFPGFFDNHGDVWSPVLRWSNKNYFIDLTEFYVDGARDGRRASFGHTWPLTQGWSTYAHLNYADGPFRSQEAVIGKLGISNYQPQRFIESMGVELSEILYQEDPFDRRGFAVTFSLQKSLFVNGK